MAEEAIFEEVEGVYVGIDFGTSNSVVTYFKDNKFQQVKFKNKKIVPTALFYRGKNDIVFGEQALKRGVTNPEFLIREFKRDIGTKKKYSITFKDSTSNTNEDSNIYVIDTNIFINEPLILDNFSKSNSIKLANSVISELSNLANKDDVKVNAEMALEHIDKKKYELNISFEESHLDLLPEDLTVNSSNDDNDNRILSIAKFFSNNKDSDKKVVLLTNDNGLKLKAESNDVSVMNFSEFHSYKTSLENKVSSETITITPKEASRKFLQFLKEESEKSIKEDITKAVITVPANFNPTQIALIKEAGEEAGFEEVAIQKEPVAVGFAYALEESSEDKTILVYDFGGGTFDASFLKVSDKKIEIIETDGDNQLGGKDITQKVMDIIFDNILDEVGLDMFEQEDSELSIIDYNKNLERIKQESERVKIELSDYEKVNVEIPNLINSDSSSFNVSFELTRKKFEDEISEIRKKSIDIIINLINNSGISVSDIDEIVMAGGSSKIPSIRQSLKDTFGKEPKQSIDTSVVISQGGAIEAIKQWSDKTTIQDKIVSNPTALKDFGIEIKGFNFDVLIPQDTALPFSVTKEYSTEKDNQEVISIKTFQRNSSLYPEAKKTYDNGIEFVDEIKIEGIPPRRIGELVIKVIFELTRDDSLEINVEILDTNGNVIKKESKLKSEASK